VDRRTIAILEDDPGRIEGMRAALARDLAAFAVVIHGAAPAMIAWLRDHLGETALISLDNDLIDPDGVAIDVGEGRDVADVLCREAPCCPVILHTSNSSAAHAMAQALGEAGWPLCRVVPHSSLEWIEDVWARHVRQFLRPPPSHRVDPTP